ncbi:exonuclease 1 [Cladophialophora yegresii CBS 114405]|uniref:Exonuclease 1 n=1 Tax=Cladophialophora yegresii CBS 114405 TaxID=1182544 RepID=W9W5N5_9EURO|nr:exonuclease 1 [Cladophialophora yegresii CBS 114405]EXJ60325.1 exonuclease 1 [Cladophialophora yegresii CBS 114405]
MGIKGLLPLLKSIHKHSTLKKFSGQTIGVDAYGWLHRGVVGCAFALALDKPTTIHIDFVLSRVRMLIDFGVSPYLVFDGDNLPSKAGTNAARRKKREESRALGLELHKAGKTTQAQQELQKAIDVTPLMARQLIEELKKLNVQYIVAPYEADAQLVYLERKGIIDGILAEDSDMLVFGATRLLTKLNQYGELVEIERADFAMCKEISLAGWTDTMFRRMAILSGCDYLPNIGKLGLKTAHGLVRKYNDVEKILRIVQLEGKMIVPTGYLEDYRNAELTFLHHRVFCPTTQKVVHLNELAPGMSDTNMPFLGPHIDPETALGVACGDLDPFSKRPLQVNKSLVRPALGDRRRQSYGHATDLKSKKSIETFFQPCRQPLAELDPNSLTPSPSQQRLLERNRNASWEPRLVNSAPALRRSTTIVVPPSVPADRASFLARAATMSTYQPPKRQRLCSDSADPSPTKEMKQSPFFPVKGADASPLAQKMPKTRRSQKSKFEVFADDNRGMLLGSEVQQAASPDHNVPRKASAKVKLPLPLQEHDSQASVPQSSPIAKSPKQPLSSPSASMSPSHNSATVKEIDQDDDPDGFGDLLDYHIRKQNEALTKAKLKGSLMETFGLQTQHRRDRSLRSLQSLPPIDPGQQTYDRACEEVQIGALRSMPKARDGDSVCDREHQFNTWDRSPRKVRQAALESLNRRTAAPPAPHLRNGVIGDRQPSTQAEGHTSAPGTVRGSEDALVPNSEDESSVVGSPQPKFDLSVFSFVSA